MDNKEAREVFKQYLYRRYGDRSSPGFTARGPWRSAGFLTADRVAQALDTPCDVPERVAAGM